MEPGNWKSIIDHRIELIFRTRNTDRARNYKESKWRSKKQLTRLLRHLMKKWPTKILHRPSRRLHLRLVEAATKIATTTTRLLLNNNRTSNWPHEDIPDSFLRTAR